MWGPLATNQMRAWLLALLELPRTRSVGAASREGESWLSNGVALNGKRDGREGLGEVGGKKLPDDMGDCPTLPQEMLDLLGSLRAKKSDGVWGGATSNRSASGPSLSWRVARAG